jgi:hypothetical protein
MKDESMSQQQDQAVNRNDPAIDPQVPGESAGDAEPNTTEPDSGHSAVDQKQHNTDNDNAFSPGFKPTPDRPTPGEDTDADIDTDGG